MKLSPLKGYGRPGYPIRPEVDAQPELLRLLPKRWQGNAAVVAALTACLAMSCRSASAAKDTPSRVAPIFEHGDGAGSFGCIATNPPVFLSEDEARKVIVDEAKRAGIEFAADGKVMPAVKTPVTSRWGFREDFGKNGDYHAKKRGYVRAVTLDGFDERRHVAFEYVSKSDFMDWHASLTGLAMSTVSHYDIVGAAKDLREGIVKAKPGGACVVFYDPCVGPKDAEKRYGYRRTDCRSDAEWKAERAKVEAMQRDLAREQLRAQVKDFIKWLKAQGVI